MSDQLVEKVECLLCGEVYTRCNKHRCSPLPPPPSPLIETEEELERLLDMIATNKVNGVDRWGIIFRMSQTIRHLKGWNTPTKEQSRE